MNTLKHKKILQIGKTPVPALEAELDKRFSLIRLLDQTEPDEFIRKHGEGIEGIVTGAVMGLPEWIVDALPDLKVVSSFGVGYESLAVDAAIRRGVQMGYTPGVLTDCVADMAFTLLLSACRAIVSADQFVREGRWLSERFPMQPRVSGKKLGIVGLGRVGSEVARRAMGFKMSLGYTNLAPVEGFDGRYFGSLDELAEWCDFLVVTVAGGASTQKLITEGVLRKLGTGGILINVARGSVVDERALIAALDSGMIHSAGLDVFSDEPQVPEGLVNNRRVVLAPHISSTTFETRQAMADLVIDNLEAFFNTGRVVSGIPGTVSGE